MTTMFFILFLIIALVIIYFKPKLILFSGVTLGYLFLGFYFHKTLEINLFVLILLTMIALPLIVVSNILPLRRRLTQMIYDKAKPLLPPISETEKLALDAGDAWYEKEIFQGNPNFDNLHALHKFSLSDEEQSFLNNETRELCAMIDEWTVTHLDRDLPIDVWNFIREKGFLGLVISKEYGGKGFSAAAHSEIVMKIATKSTSAAVTVMVPNSLGPGELLHHYGTPEQKDHYLPRLARGIEIPCFALTGPTAGSDATSIPDEGIVCMGEYNGQNVLGIRLQNVNKRYITLAPVATLVGLAFKLYDPEKLLKGTGREGITCALLPHDHPGLEIGNRLYPLSMVFMNGTIRVTESFIPIDWIIGGQTMAGEGWRMLVECLSIGRSISLPACGTANALLSTVTTSAYSSVREQFKTPIGHFEGVQDVMSKMGGLTYMMNATRQFTVAAVDAGIKPAVASAISKYHLTENGRVVLNHAMDVHAGRAIILGPNNYLARSYEGIPVGITVEGANIMTRNLLIYGQGMMQCHPYLRDIYESLADENGLDAFDKAAFGYAGFFMQNKLRAIVNGLTCGKLNKGYNSVFKHYYKDITRLSSGLAFVSDCAIILLNGGLKRRERISARLGDAMSYLYMASATLKFYKDNGEVESDKIYVDWVLQHCLYHAQNALCETLENFGIKYVSGLIKFLVFPYGKVYKLPNDTLEHKISQDLMDNSPTRQLFKEMCFVPHDMKDPVGRVEMAFLAELDTHPVKQKLRQAIKDKKLMKGRPSVMARVALEQNIISQEELELLIKADQLAGEVIQVDEFGPYELGPKNAHPEWALGKGAFPEWKATAK